MDTKNIISLIDGHDHLIKIDYTKIDGLTYGNTMNHTLTLLIQGNSVVLSNSCYMTETKNRLEALAEIDKIGLDNLNEELHQLRSLLVNPEKAAEQDLEVYSNIFFSSYEVRTYPSRSFSMSEVNQEKFDKIKEKINIFKEQSELNNTIDSQNNPSTKSHFKI